MAKQPYLGTFTGRLPLPARSAPFTSPQDEMSPIPSRCQSHRRARYELWWGAVSACFPPELPFITSSMACDGYRDSMCQPQAHRMTICAGWLSLTSFDLSSASAVSKVTLCHAHSSSHDAFRPYPTRTHFELPPSYNFVEETAPAQNCPPRYTVPQPRSSGQGYVKM